MRMLACNIDSEILKDIEYDELYIVDNAEDIEDAIYHLQVRFYNLVVIKEDNIKNCIQLLRTTFNSNTAFVIMSDNADKKFELKCLKNGALFVIKTPIDDDLLMARLEAIHRDNFNNEVKYKEYFTLKRVEKRGC